MVASPQSPQPPTTTNNEGFTNLICILLDMIDNRDWVSFEKALYNKDAFIFISNHLSICDDFNGAYIDVSLCIISDDARCDRWTMFPALQRHIITHTYHFHTTSLLTSYPCLLSSSHNNNNTGMTLLHAIVRYDPPITLLSDMIKLYPSALFATDCLGRTALHVAAGSCTSLDTIKLLIMAYPHACNIQDSDGRTPLIIACDSSCVMFQDTNVQRGPPDFQVIRLLLSGSKQSVLLEDCDETDAIECAILSDASAEVVKLLQKVKQNQLKKMASTPPPPPSEITPSSSPSNAMIEAISV